MTLEGQQCYHMTVQQAPALHQKRMFTPILSLKLLLLQTMHAFVLSSSGLERPVINIDMYMQLEKVSHLIEQPLAGGPSAPTQYLSNRSFCMLLPQLPALSGFAAYVAKCSHQLSESEQVCHSSCDHSLSIQPNAKGNVVGQRPSTTRSEGDGLRSFLANRLCTGFAPSSGMRPH